MIGIFTPYQATNFGTRLQAYAVQQIINEYDDSEIISYMPGRFENIAIKVLRNLFFKKYYDTKSSLEGVQKRLIEVRKKALDSFDQYYRLSDTLHGRKELLNHAQSYNAVVCGSDQIWNPINLVRRLGMLEFVPENVDKISFSASFGVSEIPDKFVCTYKNRLSRFQHISVREINGMEILSKLGVEGCWTLDPTLVLDTNKWNQLASKGRYHYEKPYIFCYFMGGLPLGREFVKVLKEKTGCNIVNMPHFKSYVSHDINFADIDLYDVTPIDFLGLIQNASYVCTDSFHGTALALKFNKEIITCVRHSAGTKGNTNSRIKSLLEYLEIPDREITSVTDCDRILSNSIDYDMVNKKIEEKKEFTQKYIEYALKRIKL